MANFSYFQKSLAAQFSAARFKCPNCGGDKSRIVDRKYLITQLRRCSNCQILFRTPTDDPADNASFYETEYNQGFTTDIPSDDELVQLKKSNFVGHEKDYSYYIRVLTQLGLKPGAKIFDYGCSWGYGSYQFIRAGFDVTSFEVAPTRRRFAHEKLGIATVDDMERAATDLALNFDCFFSAHVLEHVPSPAQSFSYAMSLLKLDGLFVSFTPNGSDARRAITPNWSSEWGEVHPNYIDDLFFDKSFKLTPRVVGSSPVNNASVPSAAEKSELKRIDKVDRGELFFAAKKVGNTWG
jgi:hypothetical protein